MKKVILIMFTLALFTLSIVGCGVPVEVHDRLLAEKDALVTERSNLIDEREVLVAEKDALTSERDMLLVEQEVAILESHKLIAEQEDLVAQRETFLSERDTLWNERTTLELERNTLLAELSAIQEVYPLEGFATLTEFKGWITAHSQPETTYLPDAFLAACKVQEEAMADGYLMGLDIDDYGDDEGVVVLTTFVGNQLYWWFAEDEELYASMGGWYRQ